MDQEEFQELANKVSDSLSHNLEYKEFEDGYYKMTLKIYLGERLILQKYFNKDELESEVE